MIETDNKHTRRSKWSLSDISLCMNVSNLHFTFKTISPFEKECQLLCDQEDSPMQYRQKLYNGSYYSHEDVSENTVDMSYYTILPGYQKKNQCFYLR